MERIDLRFYYWPTGGPSYVDETRSILRDPSLRDRLLTRIHAPNAVHVSLEDVLEQLGDDSVTG